MAKSYQDSGVSLEAGYEVVSRIKPLVASTMRKGCMGGIGAFGGMFDLGSLDYRHPILVSGTDGVGTKLKIAFAMEKYDTVGIDAVAMCVNDVLAQGAEPLVFLDYVAVGKNEPAVVADIVAGVAEGCRQAGCALVGGETAEMPGMYPEGEFDIAGFSVGCVEKEALISPEKVKEGDVLIGLPSSGVHSNGFSLVRKIIADRNLDLNKIYPRLDTEKSLGEVLLTPTKIYIKPVLDLIANADVHGVAHITGGGFIENIPRMIPEGLTYSIDEGTWEVLPIFRFLQEEGGIPAEEMYNVFNMGIGMVVAVDPQDADKAVQLLRGHGVEASKIGHIIAEAK